MEAMRRKIMEDQLAAIEQAKQRQQQQQQQQAQSSSSSTLPSSSSTPAPAPDSTSSNVPAPSQSRSALNPAVSSIAPRNKHAPPPKVKLYQPILNPANGSAASATGIGSRTDPIMFGESSRILPPTGVRSLPQPPSAPSSSSAIHKPGAAPQLGPTTTINHNSTASSNSSSSTRTAYSPFVPPSVARSSPTKIKDPFSSPRATPSEDPEMRSRYDGFSESSGAGPSIDAATRDKQIRDLVSNMVNIVDVPSGETIDSKIPGLKCTLLPHQVQGVSWMKERERRAAKGGILADDMGLGKTVQALALILSNRPGMDTCTMDDVVEIEPMTLGKGSKTSSKQPQRFNLKDNAAGTQTLASKTTLIVAPLAVIRQWEREVAEKTDAGLKVYVYHGPQRTRSAATFKNHDIVITTYTTAASEYNSLIAKAVADAQGSSSKPSDPTKTKRRSKQKQTRPFDSDADSSRSGELDRDSSFESSDPPTPAAGSPRKKAVKKTICTPLFDFDWLRIVLDEAQNIKNAKAKCSLACFRLSQRSTSRWCLTGTPIQNDAYEIGSLIHFLRVPPFDDFAHFKEKIGEPLKSTNQNRVNWGMKRLCFVLETIMLRRTKDATTLDGKPILTLPGRKLELINLEFESPEEAQFYADLEQRIKNTMDQEDEKEKLTGKKKSFVHTLILLLRLRQACSHPSLVTMSVGVDAAAINIKPANGDKSKVDKIDEEPKTKKKGGARKSKVKGLDSDDDGSSDDDSDDSFVDAKGGDDDDDDGLAAMLSSMSVGTKRCKQCSTVLPPSLPPSAQQGDVDMNNSNDSKASDLCDGCSAALVKHSPRLFSSTTPSTKIVKMLSLLSAIRRGDPTEKTIIFSQFTSFLNVLELHLRQHSYSFVRYDGSMRPGDRESALTRIRTDPSVTVILISFKAGSTGLNLTCCSRVILMDLWWNPQIEEQAFDRAHRLGQTRDVVIYKLSINNTVEQRILSLQQRKKDLANAALQGTKLSKKANKLDHKEIWYLFNGQH